MSQQKGSKNDPKIGQKGLQKMGAQKTHQKWRNEHCKLRQKSLKKNL